MKNTRHILPSIVFSIVSIVALSSTSVFALSINSPSIATMLSWKTGKAPGATHCSLCDGYYAEPLALTEVPVPPPYQTTTVTVTAKGPVVFRVNGDSVLKDHVVLTQPGRIMRADKAILHRDAKLGKITHIHLIGNVSLQEDGKILRGDKADFDTLKNTVDMNEVVYRIAGEYQLLTISTPFNAWGTAKTIHRTPKDEIDLTNASYSTCSPKNPTWIMTARSIQLDRRNDVGYAHNVVIRFKKIPIFYTPYFSFPLTSKRKSGFLTPSFGYQSGTGQKGFFISEPYYWNIAPNYDFTFTPTLYSERGMQLNGLFRYLTPFSDGNFYVSFLPYDRQFVAFRTNTLNTISNYSSPDAAPYFTELKNSSNSRYFINFDNNVQFDSQWSGKFNARYVSDSYYEEDFQSDYLTQNTNQIPSFGEVNYQGTHWQDIFLVQAYQTLHPIDQYPNQVVQNQYTRLPEMDFGASYPQFYDNLNFNLSMQAVNFVYQSNFVPFTYQMPIGTRLHIQPSISRLFTWSSFYITPQLTADSTNYFSQSAVAVPAAPRAEYTADRTLPIFDIDSGLYFDRNTTIGHRDYIQTLQPRIFYLYTPYANQNNYPNFDTQLLPFSTDYLYSLNQFSGFDRLQNANQLSFGLTTNLLRADNANNVLSARIGLIDYFANPAVCLSSTSCFGTSQSISPITGSLTWNPNALWTINSQAAWDTALAEVNNAQVGAEYHFLEHHIILLNYQFAHGNSDIPYNAPGFTPNSSLVGTGLVWPLSRRWNFFGYLYYDLTLAVARNDYIGLSYNSCCWALRVVASNNWNSNTNINGSPSFQNKYSTTYYVEFLLKGLGSAGYGSAENMLTATLPGFSDVFSNNGHYAYGDVQ